MFMKPPRPRGFEYFPFVHKESQTEDEEDGLRIKFRRIGNRPPAKRRPVIAFAILAVAVYVLLQYFGELVKKDPKVKTTGTFEVEEIIVVD